MKIIALGNCQADSVAKCMRAMLENVEVKHKELQRPKDIESIVPALSQFDAIYVQPQLVAPLSESVDAQTLAKLRYFPRLTFSGYHPDIIYVEHRGERVYTPMGAYNSAIVLHAWSNGLSIDETVDLFDENVFLHLGFFDYWERSKRALLEEGRSGNLDMSRLIDRWETGACFMHSFNHPRLFAVADMTRALLVRDGFTIRLADPSSLITDGLIEGPIWPVYPSLDRSEGNGHYVFKASRKHSADREQPAMLSLRDFVQASFHRYAQYPKGELQHSRLQSKGFQTLLDKFGPRASTPAPVKKGEHPYRALPDHCFWRSTHAVEPAEFDPVVSSGIDLAPADRIATAGSCFAQHIAQALQKKGFNYYVAETQPESMTAEEAWQHNFGVYSCRYGNLYTARQLVQLFDRAYGRFVPHDRAWVRADGKLADPFRPEIEPNGFATRHELETSRVRHLAAVRQMFETLDVFIFTLGLTEAWRAKADGAVFPLAPGVAAGAMDDTSYEFVNFRASEVTADLQTFMEQLRSVNARARVILTVSPVPLMATYENRSVLVSTTYSKSALRVAAEEIGTMHKNAHYFPSYEIITGNFNHGQYYEADLRSISPAGVEHVMRLFLKHCTNATGQAIDSTAAGAKQAAAAPKSSAAPHSAAESSTQAYPGVDQEIMGAFDIACEEELLDVNARKSD